MNIEIIDSIWNRLSRFLKSEEQQIFDTPPVDNANFVLFYKEMEVARLSFSNSRWTFVYTEEFKAQKEISPLTDFPQLHKEYQSYDLWPFFAHRIPGLSQPHVLEIINREKINKENEIDLLKRFGRQSINNPFVLNHSA